MDFSAVNLKRKTFANSDSFLAHGDQCLLLRCQVFVNSDTLSDLSNFFNTVEASDIHSRMISNETRFFILPTSSKSVSKFRRIC